MTTLLTDEQIGWELARLTIMDQPFWLRYIPPEEGEEEGIMRYSCFGIIVESPFNQQWRTMNMDDFSDRYLKPVAAHWNQLARE